MTAKEIIEMKWRLITPLVLAILSIIGTINAFILNGMRNDLQEIRQTIIKHIQSPDSHYAIIRDVNNLETRLDRIENYIDQGRSNNGN